MSKRGDIELLSDIQEAIKRIFEYRGHMSYEQFMEDLKTQDAIVRNMEIVGEAVKGLSDELKGKYPQVSWSELAKVRDKLIHHYFGVNYDIVIEIIDENLPKVQQHIEEISGQMSG